MPKFARRFSLITSSSPPLLGISRARCGCLRQRWTQRQRHPQSRQRVYQGAVEGTLSEGDGVALPSFPEPTRPRRRRMLSSRSSPLRACCSTATTLRRGPSVWWRLRPAGRRAQNRWQSSAPSADKAIGLGASALRSRASFRGLGSAPRSYPRSSLSSGEEAARGAHGWRRRARGRCRETSFVDGVIGGGATFKRFIDGRPTSSRRTFSTRRSREELD